LFEHAREQRDLYRALIGGRGGAVALGAIRQMLSDLIREELAAAVAGSGEDGPPPREFVVQYLVGAYMAVLTSWLDGGAKLPPERVDAIFRRLSTDGVLRR
jgi:hypothetical protein